MRCLNIEELKTFFNKDYIIYKNYNFYNNY